MPRKFGSMRMGKSEEIVPSLPVREVRTSKKKSKRAQRGGHGRVSSPILK